MAWSSEKIARVRAMAEAGYSRSHAATEVGSSLAMVDHISRRHRIAWVRMSKAARAGLVGEGLRARTDPVRRLAEAKAALAAEIAAAKRDMASRVPPLLYRGRPSDLL